MQNLQQVYAYFVYIHMCIFLYKYLINLIYLYIINNAIELQQ